MPSRHSSHLSLPLLSRLPVRPLTGTPGTPEPQPRERTQASLGVAPGTRPSREGAGAGLPSQAEPKGSCQTRPPVAVRVLGTAPHGLRRALACAPNDSGASTFPAPSRQSRVSWCERVCSESQVPCL